MGEELVGAGEIAAAASRLAGLVLRTPLVALGTTGVLLKAESLQASGSFKLRGALNSMLVLDDEARRRGVVAHSSGNHAIAVALAGRTLGIGVTIVMPSDAPAVKLQRTTDLGATVVLVGPESDVRRRRADEIAVADGLTMIEPYDSRSVLAATATIGEEIVADLGDRASRSTIYVPVSGGGLAGGVAAGAKLRCPDVQVVGVEPEVAADALASRRAGRRVALPAEQMARTIADGLRVQQVGELNWPHLDAYLDDIVTVTEGQIRDAMRKVAQGAGLVAEPSAAVSVAAAIAGTSIPHPDSTRVAVLTGCNVDASLLADVISEGGGATPTRHPSRQTDVPAQAEVPRPVGLGAVELDVVG